MYVYIGLKGQRPKFGTRNVERSIFQNFLISNITITEDQLFDCFIVKFIFFIFYKLFEQPKCLIIFQIVKY